jgi:hypothetical protein
MYKDKPRWQCVVRQDSRRALRMNFLNFPLRRINFPLGRKSILNRRAEIFSRLVKRFLPMEPERNPYQEPAMPARQRPRDIVIYNAWADRVGQPRWGADAPVNAFARAAARRHRGRPAFARPEPNVYGLPAQPVVAGGWQRGTYWVNRTEWAVNSEGRPRKLRAWNSRTGQHTWFPAGRDY